MGTIVIISGFLYGLSDNIIPLIKDADVFVHSWNTDSNNRWINKLERYRKYCNNLTLTIERQKFENKLYSHLYSTFKAAQSVPNLEKYDLAIKLKPNLDTEVIKFEGRIEEYFTKAFISCRPLLDNFTYKDCIYGLSYYNNFDERFFSAHPLVFKKLFHILEEEFIENLDKVNTNLTSKYGKEYEGSIFWKEWLESLKVPIILDTDLQLPNTKRNWFEKY